MYLKKRVCSLLLSIVIVLGLLPAGVFATGADQVYISVSYDGEYITCQNNAPLVYLPVSLSDIAGVDLEEYGLSEYLYDEDGDGTPEITALQLVIYAHETLYGGDWNDVTFTGGAGSSYFQGGIFGFDENLNYYLNGEYPLAGEGWGATSDQIVLEAGDYLDIASFSSWDFYMDSNYGFHFFADEDGAFTHGYTAEAGTELSVKLVRSYSAMGAGAGVLDAGDYTVSYGPSYGNATGTVTTDESGCAAITFPAAGKWYLWADGGYGAEYPTSIVSAPAYAEVTVTAKAEEPEAPSSAQDVSAVLEATMEQLASTVTEPVFGTTAGEWTVFSLARGGYYGKNSKYFTEYYDRIVTTVNETAASVNMNGALHKNKSTENARLIVALSAIGKDATSVGDWNLVEAYSANGFSWIKKQGLNGTIWALIALDSNHYSTSDTTIRQQCVDAILAAQHDDGGWSLMANTAYASDPDITGMALTALYPYRNQAAVAEACEEAFDCLSAMQHDNGTFASGGSECAESCSWVIVACTTWGINPDTDSRFIKGGNSVVDGLLAHYLQEEARFEHIIGAGSNAMATDQSCYGLIAYERLLNEKASLYDMSDVTFEEPEDAPTDDPTEEPTDAPLPQLSASLGVPAQINAGDSFNAVVSIKNWDNEAGLKLIDMILTIPEGVSVTGVTLGSPVSGGDVIWHLEEATRKLRVVCFDPIHNSDLQISGSSLVSELFVVGLHAEDAVPGDTLNVTLTGLSAKRSSDSTSSSSMAVADITSGSGFTTVVAGISYSAVCLYQGDDVDLIPSGKKGVAVYVTGIEANTGLTFHSGSTTVQFSYSREITEKTGISSYIALVDASLAMELFVDADNFTLTEGAAASLTFGDTNADGLVNAQDALSAVHTWLRKTDEPTDDVILTMNVNGDSRINTFDALGIVDAFVNGTDHGIVTKAATVGTDPS